MGILVGKETRVLVHGITGKEGSFHTQQMLEYGTQVVAGMTPGKGGQTVAGIPVYNTVREAVESQGANCSILFVPPAGAADSIMEAAAAGIEVIVCITEGIPVLDMVRVKQFLKGKHSVLIGPNCPGIITPGACKVGIMPGYIFRPGSIGVISRSGTLTYEVVDQISKLIEAQKEAARRAAQQAKKAGGPPGPGGPPRDPIEQEIADFLRRVAGERPKPPQAAKPAPPPPPPPPPVQQPVRRPARPGQKPMRRPSAPQRPAPAPPPLPRDRSGAYTAARRRKAMSSVKKT